jgi:phospholipase A1
MTPQKKLSLTHRLCLLCTLTLPLQPTAKELLTIEQAIFNCKTTYPSQFEAKKRLACFDSISTPTIEETSKQSLTDNLKINEAPSSAEIEVPIAIIKPAPTLTYLERKWRLTSQGDWDISDFETHKSNYLLITHTNNVNDAPISPNQISTLERNLDDRDLKFQLSLKTEMMNNIPLIRNLPYVTSARIWGAYTQQSYWQVFDTKASRPLRENNYEPELILSLGIDNQVAGVKKNYIPRMLNLGVVHQSNGRSNPVSRSWNRIYLEGGWELYDQLSLTVRPWWRIPENKDDDDNADIEKFIGYGDLAFRWEDVKHKNAATLLLRNNLRSDNNGFAQIDLQRQVFNNPYLKLHLMFSTGYGASLLDYNHSQNILGLGISLGE